jgi:hypothetical protein
MSTAAALLDRVQRQLLSGTVEQRNKLAVAVDASETSFVTTYDVGGLRPGTVFEVDSELCYIWEVNQGTKTLTVERGYSGTTPATHSIDSTIVINPRFPKAQMFDALNQDIDDLASPVHGLFAVVSIDLPYNGSDRQIDITGATNVIDLIEVRLRYLSDDYPIIRGTRLQRNLPTTDFPSGYSIVFDDDIMAGTLRVTYKSGFSRVSSLTDDIQSVAKVPTTMEDILEMGVIMRILSSREVKRSFLEGQGDTRRPDEVPVGAMRDSFANVLRLRRDRIIAEKAKLVRQYPLTIRS